MQEEQIKKATHSTVDQDHSYEMFGREETLYREKQSFFDQQPQKESNSPTSTILKQYSFEDFNKTTVQVTTLTKNKVPTALSDY